MTGPTTTLRGVTKVYATAPEGRPAVDAIDLDLEPGTATAIVGPNGSGKSTLLALVAGVLTPTAGRIERPARCASLLELGAGYHPDLTGSENLDLGLALAGVPRRRRAAVRAQALEFSGLGAAIDQPLKHFSSGMVGRLAGAVALHTEPDLLLVDEVLAVGDASFQRAMLTRVGELRTAGTAVVVVTHSPDLAIAATDRALWLDHGRLVDEGPTGDVLLRYEAAVRGWAHSPLRGRVELADLALSTDRLTPGDPLELRAVLRVVEDVGPLEVRLEVRPVVGADTLWMRDHDETPEERYLNLVAATERLHVDPLAVGDHDLVVSLPAVPISPTLVEVSVVLRDAEDLIVDELGATLDIGAVNRRPHFHLVATPAGASG